MLFVLHFDFLLRLIPPWPFGCFFLIFHVGTFCRKHSAAQSAIPKPQKNQIIFPLFWVGINGGFLWINRWVLLRVARIHYLQQPAVKREEQHKFKYRFSHIFFLYRRHVLLCLLLGWQQQSARWVLTQTANKSRQEKEQLVTSSRLSMSACQRVVFKVTRWFHLADQDSHAE